MRPLSQIEEALTITNIAYPLSAVCVLKIRNGPLAEVLQLALEQLQSKYPLLQAHIKENKGRFYFKEDKDKRKVSLRVVERTDDKLWQDLCNEDLNLGYDHTIAPLMRAIYLTSSSSNKSEIILSFHHAVMDSSFILSFANQLLSSFGDVASGLMNSQQVQSAAHAASPLLKDVLPPSFKMPAVLTRFFPFIFRQLKGDISYKMRTGTIKDLPIPPSSENDIYTLGFSEDETIGLIKWSRKNKVSLNSILSASMLMVVNRFNYDSKKSIMRTAQFANLRPYLSPSIPNNIDGCFIAMMRFSLPISNDTNIKKLATDLDEQVRKSLKRGDKYLFTLLSKMLIKKSFREKKERLSATALSYAGAVQLKKQYGDILVSDVHGFITNNSLGPELSGFGKICFNRLSLDLNFLSAETNHVKAIEMVDELKMILQQLIKEQ